MRQKAIVLEANQNIARIKVFRSAMCDGCAKRGDGSSCACGALVGANRVMYAEASNELGAKPGDAVEIETDTSVVLGYAALVFLLPVVVFFLAYSAADYFSEDSVLPWIVGGGSFLLSFIPVLIADRLRRNKTPQIRIVAFAKTFDELG